MSISKRVLSLTKKQSKDQAVTQIVAVMKEMGWSIAQLKETPIPSYLVIADELGKQARKTEAEMKKNQRRR